MLAPLKGLCFYRVEVRWCNLPGGTAMLLWMRVHVLSTRSPYPDAWSPGVVDV